MRGLVVAVASSLIVGCSGSGAGAPSGDRPPTCGDGVVSAPEVCDGASLGGNDCTTVAGGFVRGTLACAADCLAFVTTGCAGPACGDGIVTAPEVCDGANLGGKDCTTIPGGYVGGTLACAGGCLELADWRCALPPGPTCSVTGICLRFDAAERLADIQAACRTSFGASAVWDPQGTCTVAGAVPGYCDVPDLSFMQLSIPGASARVYLYTVMLQPGSAISTCRSMIGGVWSGVGAWTCGDGAVTGPEVCDGANLGGATCESLGAVSGTLACAADCLTFDGSGCTATTRCDIPGTSMHTCIETVLRGILPPEYLDQARTQCEGMSGTYAAAPCPTADTIGSCDLGTGQRNVYYVPTDPALARATCILSRGTWVPP